MIELKLPELGENIDQAEVSRVLVSEGDTVQVDQNVLELESDKASFPLPSTHAGRVGKIRVKVGDSVSVGQTLLEIEESQPAKPKTEEKADGAKAKPAAAKAQLPRPKSPDGSPKAAAPEPGAKPAEPKPGIVAAGPATRALARELGVNLEEVEGHGPGGRITREDVKAFTKSRFQPDDEEASPPLSRYSGRGVGGEGSPPPQGAEQPQTNDFPGPVTRQRLSPLARAAAERLSLAWRTVPHVTQHGLADITELEKGRQRFNATRKGAGPKLTATVLAIRAAVAALKAFPRFNSSLDEGSRELILKDYYHIGIAVDTEHGLLVPVVRDADRKSLLQLAAEITELAAKARDRSLTKKDMEGGSFTISNLGGIGGTAFTPIVNYPEVAILGISQARWQIIADEEKQERRLLLPLSLSYDHRVINGADGARFLVRVAGLLSDPFALLAES